ncbi:MAG: citrate synthase [Candidatus Dormibacteraeota bacterium]|uniref:Citrate synthase n=2 Tax=Candidatus Nephthysia bennettiae TaxID=3127016 RepID=A0A934JZ11_9BACT|nr:citrate synthase [Candidatus Dormibacteraeota bacterium]
MSMGVSAGLEGVSIGETRISFVDGQNGRLVYSAHDAVELAESRSFEEVWFLLHNGRLPAAGELRGFTAELRQSGRLKPEEVEAVLPVLRGEPMAALRSALSVLAASRGLRPWLNRALSELSSEAVGLAAATPQLVEMVLHRRGPMAWDEPAGYAERYLWGVLGGRPEPGLARALEAYLILTADHGMNASTFAARVATSTAADAGGALVAAIATLSGPLHGGAPGPVLDMLDAAGTREEARRWISAELAAGRRLMGFGHRVYRVDDPRAVALRRVATEIGGPRVELARAVEQEALSALAELKPSRPLRTNVEFWTAMVLERCGIPREAFSLTFTSSRMADWTAHVIEQASHNRLIRPTADYTGPMPPPPP